MPLHRSLKSMLKLCLSLLVLQSQTTRIGTATAAALQSRIAKPGCPNKCGNVSVPYPFGLKEGCYLNSSTSFFLNCSHNETLFFSPNSASYGLDRFRVRYISHYGRYLSVDTPIVTACNNEIINKPIITSPEFPFSSFNHFVVVGCDTFGIIATSGNSTGCSTFCINDTDFSQVSPPTGTGCCQTPNIPAGSDMWNYTIQLRRATNDNEMGGKVYLCSSAFIAADHPYNMFQESGLNTIGNRYDITAIINWPVGNESCSEAKSKVSFACKAKHTLCKDAQNPTGYRCICKYLYEYNYNYNPYLEHGCPGPWASILIFIGGRLEIILQSQTTRIGTATAAALQSRIAKPGCPNKCGNVSVPYPFGLKEGCYLNSSTSFFLNCSHNETLFFSPNSASYGLDRFRVRYISHYGRYLSVDTPIVTACNNEIINKPIITSPEFPFSSFNHFVVVGCDTFGIIATSGNSTGCSPFCINDTDFSQVSPCTGTGCCQTPCIPAGSDMWNYTIQLRRVTNHTEMHGKEYPCSSAFLAYSYDMLKESELNTIGNRDDITAIINWAVGNESCSEAKSKVSYACKAKHSDCEDAQNPTGYTCFCKYRYEYDYYINNGLYSPYFEGGCPGPSGSIRSFTEGILLPLIQMVVVCRMLLGILFCAVYILWRGIRKKMLKKRKEQLFKRNGGHLLQDSLPIFQGATNPIRMFTAHEMEMATYKFDEKNIIGRGGFGVVYKGYLPEVGALAIKKSKMFDQTEIKQFINEVVLLSKIHHKNVVTFLGCCLEMDVPLLVYEFVSNGTLKTHLHGGKNQEILPWTTRLKIAVETAGVLAYLQNNHRPPVIHRDVKPDNILLDENLNAKVSDFGLSRLVTQNESHMHTKVQGTFGYLDPEYFRTSELTEKSDVYSLGVVLLELITRKKLLTNEYSILVEKFESLMRDNNVYGIIDQDIVNEENAGEIMEVAKLANKCLRYKGEERPTMDEVAVHLKSLWTEVEHKQSAPKSYNLEEKEELISKGHPNTHVARPTSTGSHISLWYLSGGR